MAKSRAQRKAEQRKREAELQKRARDAQQKARKEVGEPTGAGESLEELDHEAELDAGAPPEDVGYQGPGEEVGELSAEPVRQSRREERRQAKERARAAKESAKRREGREVEVKERGAVAGFFASVARELSRVQWPDRDTLVQASAVTLLFVAVAATYLGVLDAIFSRVVKAIL